ncbi:MAG: AAA family ATPase [Sphingobacteriales bacterium]|nr:MAG: AAA family ATPase [Sphingobacteriales bacterium]
MKKDIFMAATGQHIGKTTTTLGILHALKLRGINVGYCKPVGQEFTSWKEAYKVDKDSLLFSEAMRFELEPHIHSPVIVLPGYTEQYINQPEKEINTAKLDFAAEVLRKRHEVVLYEGTGHPGVGSVIDLSNADVAKRLDAGVIIVVKGGIGDTYDHMMLAKTFFDSVGAKVHGVIINKVLRSKMDKIRSALEKKISQTGLEIFGFIPFEEELAYPLVSTITRELQGEVLCNPDKLTNLVEGTIAGSLVDLESLNPLKQYLLVVSIRRFNDALSKLQGIWAEHGIAPNLAGVILTGQALVANEYLDFMRTYQIPTIRTHYDTYESIIKLSKLDVKLNTKAPHKIQKAIEIVEEYVNMDRICELMGVC